MHLLDPLRPDYPAIPERPGILGLLANPDYPEDQWGQLHHYCPAILGCPAIPVTPAIPVILANPELPGYPGCPGFPGFPVVL